MVHVITRRTWSNGLGRINSKAWIIGLRLSLKLKCVAIYLDPILIWRRWILLRIGRILSWIALVSLNARFVRSIRNFGILRHICIYSTFIRWIRDQQTYRDPSVGPVYGFFKLVPLIILTQKSWRFVDPLAGLFMVFLFRI